MKEDNPNEPLNKSTPAFYSSLSGTYPVSPGLPKENGKKKVKYNSTQWLTLITLAFGNFCAGACVSLQAPFFPAEVRIVFIP